MHYFTNYTRSKMKIAITGAQSTGKSSLLDSIKRDDRRDGLLPDYVFIDELTRSIKGKGIVINENGDNLTQLLTNNTHIDNIVTNNFISDRCIIDSYVYTVWLHRNNKIDDWVLNYSYHLFLTLVGMYDKIFYLKPEFDVVDDGVRSSSITFRDEISTLFDSIISNYDIQVITLTGTIKDRTNQFYTHIQ